MRRSGMSPSPITTRSLAASVPTVKSLTWTRAIRSRRSPDVGVERAARSRRCSARGRHPARAIRIVVDEVEGVVRTSAGSRGRRAAGSPARARGGRRDRSASGSSASRSGRARAAASSHDSVPARARAARMRQHAPSAAAASEMGTRPLQRLPNGRMRRRAGRSPTTSGTTRRAPPRGRAARRAAARRRPACGSRPRSPATPGIREPRPRRARTASRGS